MPNSLPMISLVIPTHNKVHDIETCLQAATALIGDRQDVEIIVVDDGSRDDTPDVLRKIAEKQSRLRILTLEGGGPARARNAGIAASRGEIVAMLDDDVVPHAGWLDAILEPFSSPQVVAVEGKVIPIGGEHWGLLGMAPRNPEGGVYLTCNLAMRKSTLVAIGGFDEGFPYPAFEDTDLAMQAMQKGQIAWAPNAVVHHPRRQWTLARALREIRFNEALLRFALRYGCLGWEGRPTRWPRLRVLWSALISLPGGRILKGLRAFSAAPKSSCIYCTISAVQALAALVLIWPPMLRAGRAAPRANGLANLAS